MAEGGPSLNYFSPFSASPLVGSALSPQRSQVHGQIEKASKERSRLLFSQTILLLSQSLRQLLVLFMTLHDF